MIKKIDYREISNTVLLFTNGCLIAGESIALLIGMHLLSGSDNPWISTKNDFFAASDIITGALFLYLGISNTICYANNEKYDYSTFYQTNLVISFMVILFSLITHTYREIEYFNNSNNNFCSNIPLFVMNNIKLGLLLTGLSFGIVVNIKLQLK
jgi:hypothetical protein